MTRRGLCICPNDSIGGRRSAVQGLLVSKETFCVYVQSRSGFGRQGQSDTSDCSNSPRLHLSTTFNLSQRILFHHNNIKGACKTSVFFRFNDHNSSTSYKDFDQGTTYFSGKSFGKSSVHLLLRITPVMSFHPRLQSFDSFSFRHCFCFGRLISLVLTEAGRQRFRLQHATQIIDIQGVLKVWNNVHYFLILSSQNKIKT